VFPDVHHSKPSNFELTWGQSKVLIDKGIFDAAGKCFWEYDRSVFKTISEHKAEQGGSMVDFAVLVGDRLVALCEAKSPAVMNQVCNSLPPHGIELSWIHDQPLVPRVLTNVSTLFPLVTALVLRRNV
jgi:hypothetical protein